MANLDGIKFKTVQATTAADLDTALASARRQALLANEGAQYVGLKLVISDGVLFATLIWSG